MHIPKIIYFKGRLQARNGPNASGQYIYGRGGRMFYWFVPVTWEALPNTNTAAEHESHLLQKQAVAVGPATRSVISVTREAPGRQISTTHVDMLSKSHVRKSKTTVIPHELSPPPHSHPPTPRPSGYASRLQDDSLTASFQEINQSAGNEEWDRRKQKRGEGVGHPTETTTQGSIVCFP